MIRCFKTEWPVASEIIYEITESGGDFFITFFHAGEPVGEWFCDGGEGLPTYQCAQQIAQDTITKLESTC